MLVEPVAQVAHHALSHFVRQVRLHDAQSTCRHSDCRHHANDYPEQVEIGRCTRWREQRRVEYHANEQRVYDAQSCGNQNERSHDRYLEPVRRERAHNAVTKPLACRDLSILTVLRHSRPLRRYDDAPPVVQCSREMPSDFDTDDSSFHRQQSCPTPTCRC